MSKTKKAVTQTASIGESIALAFTNDVLCNGFEIKNLKVILFSNPASPEAFATYSINKGEECDNFLLAYRRL